MARDVMSYPSNPAAHKGWERLYEDILERLGGAPDSPAAIADDPNLNGFGPWQNAWLLYTGRGVNSGAYAVVIRGTIVSNKPSVMEDAVFHPLVATRFLSEHVRFSDSEAATVHSGFAHSTFTVLFDDRYGILRVLHDRVPAKSRVYIVGHSQGAAMATLVHAFLHYAARHDDNERPIFGLERKHYVLKSYGFAQPKPGNYSFATNFARITQRADNAIVINNHLDPVPKVPLTLESIADVDYGFNGSSIRVKLLHSISSVSAGIRSLVGMAGEPFIRKSAAGYSHFYNYNHLHMTGTAETAASWQFQAAGRVIVVFGTPGDPADDFYQHHATTYRRLITEQLRTR